MEELKTRYYTTPNSIASYFGCGFNSPEEQFNIDSGQATSDFDSDAKLRMELGNYLENSVIDYFQNVIFKTPIERRNTETLWGYDDKIKYKIDGMMQLEGKNVIFENKISNSQSYKFTEHKGYHMQVQSYMLCENVDSAILAGLYLGKPIWVRINRDEELINDIKEMTDFIVNALNGLVDFYKDYPNHLLEKYSNSTVFEPIQNLSQRTIDYLHELAWLNNEKAKIEKAIDELKSDHENDFDITAGVYEDEVVKVTVSRWVQKGGFDVDSFKNNNPTIDLKPYSKPDSPRSKILIKLKNHS